jgi:hypothetical protein
MFDMLLKRKRVLSLFLFFTSCASNTHNWTKETGPFQCDRFVYPQSNDFRGIEVEVREVRVREKGSGWVTFLSIHSLPFPNEEGLFTVTFFVDGEEHPFQARCLEGGQRAILSDEGSLFLIQTLESGKEITLKVFRYEQVLTPFCFSGCKN